MSYVLIDDGGKFAAGRLLSSQETSAQVELPSGKRSKVKAQAVLLRFESPSPSELISRAQAQASSIDLPLAWEFAGDADFGFVELAADYFGASAGPVEQAAVLLALQEAPHYFRRAGKGRFRRAPADQVQAALLGIERKRQQQMQIDDWASALQAGHCPPPIAEELYRILFRPDKSGPHYKAVVQAARALGKGPLEMLRAAGAIKSAYQFHWRRFLFEHFPRGTSFTGVSEAWLVKAGQLVAELPMADAAVSAFSIDDSSTTEIDDALSVRGIGTGEVTLGIHIAVPSLAIRPGDPIELQARDRMSTVYMPGHKITMLPDEVVNQFSLDEGLARPALSLYLSLDEDTLAVRRSVSRIEQVVIASNLRHDVLDAQACETNLVNAAAAEAAGLPFASELAFLFHLAKHLKAQRELVRGKPETFNRPDYSFRLIGMDVGMNPEAPEPSGEERIEIAVRRRGAPLDLIVAECMILANSTWGAWLADCGVPGIYRSQASLQPGVKVRMGTRPQRHAGIGVDQYAWSTSPLRRYCDLVNQWQLLACVRDGPTAALTAPFKPRDASLMAVIGAFDAAYLAYADFQTAIERYWTLRALQQEGVMELTATVLGQGRARAQDWPLVFHLAGVDAVPRGARVRVRLVSIDLLSLEFHGQLLERLPDEAVASSERSDGGEIEALMEDDELPAATGLALAISVDDSDAEAGESAGPASASQAQSL